jgi:predicted ArsR family transcriptional regulator
VLELLRGQPEPCTQSALVKATGLHANTVREHLDGLVRAGWVRRHPAKPRGRGRPAWLYEATGAAEESGGSEYAGLAAALARAVHRTSDSPREEAMIAGTEWGHELARDRGAARTGDGHTARRRVVDLLDDIGFAPEADDTQPVVRLTRCPLLEAAHKDPDVVCAVHLGIVIGALQEYGADPSGTELVPFSEPGACRLVLPGERT